MSLAAAHVKSADHGGTLFIVSVLSASNEVGTLFIAVSVHSASNELHAIGSLISDGNADKETWTMIFSTLRKLAILF